MARILIVDDSPSQLMGMKRIVEKLGHEALTAEDGAAGDQIVELEVRAPKASTDAQKALYQQMADAFDFDPRKA